MQIVLDRPLRLTGSRVGVGYSQESQWWLEVADSVTDLNTQGESYRLLVNEESINAFGLPDPGYAWDEASFAMPETATVARLRVERSGIVDHIYLGGWALDWAGSPCDAGANLASDPGGGFSDDVDGNVRIAPWDMGYDEASYVEPFLLNWEQEVWEQEQVGTFEVALDRPYPDPIVVSYRTYQLSATEGEDYTETTGQLTIPAGEVGAFIRPVNDDGIADDGETFNVELLDPSNPILVSDSTYVILRDGETPPEVSVAQEAVTVSESAGWALLDVCLPETEPAPVSFHWRAEDLTALMGIDYGGSQLGTTISAGDLCAEMQIPLIDDEVFRHDRAFAVSVFASNDAVVRAPSRTIVHIVDDDGPVFEFAVPIFTVDEGVDEATIDVTLSRRSRCRHRSMSRPRTVTRSSARTIRPACARCHSMSGRPPGRVSLKSSMIYSTKTTKSSTSVWPIRRGPGLRSRRPGSSSSKTTTTNP